MRTLAVPAVAATAMIALAVIGGVLVGGGGNSAVGQVLGLSSQSTTLVGNIGSWLPLGFAFAAGMVATVNPCGFVMLPAYLTMFVSDSEDGTHAPSTRLQVVKALYVSTALGLGFVLLFGTVGVAITAGARPLATVFPWIGFALGFVMAGLGAYVLGGGKLYTGTAQAAAAKIGDPRDSTLRGYFLFGISYAVASLSCTLPIFLGLVSSSLATGGFLSATGQFLAYALGMTLVITVLTLAIATFKGALVGRLRSVMPYVNSISGGILIFVGAYLVFYWLTEGGLGG
jgi:cytochrome c biogenesis protein CcdA